MVEQRSAEKRCAKGTVIAGLICNLVYSKRFRRRDGNGHMRFFNAYVHSHRAIEIAFLDKLWYGKE